MTVAPRFSVKVGYFLTDALTPGCGNTWVVPGSHDFSREGQEENGRLDHEQGVPLIAAAGDVLIFDRRLWHGGSPNESPNTRHAVFIGYAFRWLRPRFDTRLPIEFGGESAVRKQLLGVGSTKGRYEAPDSEVPLANFDRTFDYHHPHGS
jgi:ectoine hydroxylase-related dioxygenase (phytanoyl-CoA dioxygenase family)